MGHDQIFEEFGGYLKNELRRAIVTHQPTIRRFLGEVCGDRQSWRALLGIVTGLDGNLTGLQRIWLARDGGDKAPLPDPRRAMGLLLGNAVRFGKPRDIMAVGEGIETVLSLLSLFPALPMAAGLSAAHLAASLVCSFSQKRSRPASNCLIEARKSRLVSFTRPREVLSKLDEASESLFDRRTALLAIVIGDDFLVLLLIIHA
jgi:hypothetical protein